MSSPPEQPSSTAQRVASALGWCGVAALALICVHIGSQPLRFGDHFWQVRTGEMILAAGRVIAEDPFSYTVNGAPWNNHQWGYEILVALLHRGLGWGGFRVAIPLLVGGVVLGAFALVARRRGAPLGLIVAALTFQFVYYKFNPASQTLAMVVFFSAFLAFLRPGTLARPAPAVGLIVTMLVWGNLTAEALIFVPFVVWDHVLRRAPLPLMEPPAPAGDTAQIAPRLQWLVLALVCAAPFVNPPGSSVLDYALEGTAVNRLVNSEFTHLWEPARTMSDLTKWLARGVVAAWLAWSVWFMLPRETRREHVRIAGQGMACVVATIIYERYSFLLAVPMVLMALHTPALRQRRVVLDVAWLGGATAVTVAFLIGAQWTPAKALGQLSDREYYAEHLDEHVLPIACVDFIGQFAPAANIAAPRPWGNYVIWALPDAHVFVDGRNPEYPIEVHDAIDEITGPTPRASALLQATGTDVVLAQPGWGSSPFVADWITAAESSVCGVYVPRRRANPSRSGAP